MRVGTRFEKHLVYVGDALTDSAWVLLLALREECVRNTNEQKLPEVHLEISTKPAPRDLRV